MRGNRWGKRRGNYEENMRKICGKCEENSNLNFILVKERQK